MPIKDALIAELKHEANNTRKILAKVPDDKLLWKPHEKSMSIGRLATHIAEIPIWINRTMAAPEFDFATATFKPNVCADNADLLRIFDEHLANAVAVLQNAGDDALNEMFKVRRGEQVMFALPKKVMMRNFTFNHVVHHRGQLSVYLRLLDIPVPGMYGPSADER
ncbi:MAG: DinB family protein [Chitinophagaceae bacterium]